MRLKRWILALALVAVATPAEAALYTIYIRGFTANIGGYIGNAYWTGLSGNAPAVSPGASPTPILINYDDTVSLSISNGNIRSTLDTYCTGSNWCDVAAHSLGGSQIAYALSLYGLSNGNPR